MTTRLLVRIPPARRIGATVLHEGRRWAVWSYCERQRTDARGLVVGVERTCALWSDESGVAEIREIPEMESRRLEVISVHPIYHAGRKTCIRRDAHLWPGDLSPAACCERCGLAYSEFSGSVLF